MSKHTEIRLLPVQLSEAEVRLRGQELARQHAELEQLEQEEKETKAIWYRQKKAAKGEIERLAAAVNKGVEEREVECQVEKNLEAKMLITRRLDTGEVVGSIPLQTRDLQMDLADLPETRTPASPKSPKSAGKRKKSQDETPPRALAAVE